MKYSKDHVWVVPSNDEYRIGLTSYAVHELGEIVFIELPEIGRRFETGDPLCAIDSLKSASDLYAPCAGEITSVNAALENTKSIGAINQDPTGEGWVCTIRVGSDRDIESLMSETEYTGYVGESDENTD